MDMANGTLNDKVIAAINQMQQIRMRMSTQTQKHDMVQVMHLNDSVDRLAEAMTVILVAIKERGL